MYSTINAMLPKIPVSPTQQPNPSQGANAQFGSALQSALTNESDAVGELGKESLKPAFDKLGALQDLVDFLKQTNLSDLNGDIAGEELLLSDSTSSSDVPLRVLKSLVGDDASLEEFMTSIEELNLNQEQEEESPLDTRDLLGTNVVELYAVLKHVANLSEEEWQELPIEGTGNLLKLAKVQVLLTEHRDMTQDEAALQKQVKDTLEAITGKLERWVSQEQQKESRESEFTMNNGQNKSLETVRNAYAKVVEADFAVNKRGLGMPMQIVKPVQFTYHLNENEKTAEVPGPVTGKSGSDEKGLQLMKAIGEKIGTSTLNTEEGLNIQTTAPVQMSKVEQLVLSASKDGTTVNQEEFIKQFETILNKSNFTGANGVNKLLIRLNPEHLGSLRIELIQKDGMMTAKILATTAQAKDMLENQVHGLKQAFSGQNIPLERIEIAQSFNSFNSENYSQNEAEDQSRQQHERNEESKEESESDFTGSFAEALLNLEV